MILTGHAIYQAWKRGDIVIDPFDRSQLNPNSYNFRLAGTILRVNHNTTGEQSFDRIELSDVGILLQPGTLYLAATHEVIGSTRYVITLLGRSSLGRLGLFLNITADLGHAGSMSRWTLELEVVQPLKVYPYMRIGQAAFWCQWGVTEGYQGRYLKDMEPVPNRDRSLEGPTSK